MPRRRTLQPASCPGSVGIRSRAKSHLVACDRCEHITLQHRPTCMRYADHPCLRVRQATLSWTASRRPTSSCRSTRVSCSMRRCRSASSSRHAHPGSLLDRAQPVTGLPMYSNERRDAHQCLLAPLMQWMPAMEHQEASGDKRICARHAVHYGICSQTKAAAVRTCCGIMIPSESMKSTPDSTAVKAACAAGVRQVAHVLAPRAVSAQAMGCQWASGGRLCKQHGGHQTGAQRSAVSLQPCTKSSARRFVRISQRSQSAFLCCGMPRW